MKVDYKEVTGQDYKAGCPPSGTAVSNDKQSENGGEEDTVDPWNVATNSAKGVDYDKLIGNHHFYSHVKVFNTVDVVPYVIAVCINVLRDSIMLSFSFGVVSFSEVWQQ